mgnify:CR=1 FL=1
MRAFQAPIVTVLVWSVTAWRLFGLFDFFGVSMHLVKAYHWNACQCVPLWNEFWLWIYDQLQKKFQQVNSHANSFNQNTPPSPPPHKPVEHRFIDIFVLKMKGIKFSKVKLLPGRTVEQLLWNPSVVPRNLQHLQHPQHTNLHTLMTLYNPWFSRPLYKY